MSNEPKYISLAQVVEEYKNKIDNKSAHYMDAFDQWISQFEMANVQITEDAEFEIVEPKRIENKQP